MQFVQGFRLRSLNTGINKDMSNDNIFIIGEVGINHNGTLDNCFKLIDAAKQAGCDCVKFQFFKATNLYSELSGSLKWRSADRSYRYDIYKAAESSQIQDGWVDKIIAYCRRIEIEPLFSVFDVRGLKYLIKRGIKKIKLASSVISDISLIEQCAKTGLPIIISTGAATIIEVGKAVDAIVKYHTCITLMQCTMRYPTPLSECNLGVLDTYRCAFPDVQIGFSDHTESVFKVAVAAASLGAKVLEKHVTLDKGMKGPDHFYALIPSELTKMVKEVRKAQKKKFKGVVIERKLYGSTEKKVMESEKYLKDFTYPSLFAAKDIVKGQSIKVKDLKVLRKANFRDALPSEYIKLFRLFGVRNKGKIKKGKPITWKDIRG